MLEQQPDYDFHFSLRAIAKLKHAAVRSGKSCQNPSRSQTGRRKLRTFGVKELSRRVQKIKLQNLVDSLPGAGIDVLRGSKVSILQWSGETNLTVDMGCLMFIDTMNFCKAGLGKLIESHKRSALIAVNLRGQSEACGLERAFPLTASRHPFLKNARDPADEGWADAVWEALLRKLPMPWDSFADCNAFDKPAVWLLECYHSRLSGECSEKSHKLLQETARFMGFERFKEVFDCYLALDITAYADLMQIFRQHFFRHSPHRPVPLPFAPLGVLGSRSPKHHSATWPAAPSHHRRGRLQGR